MNTVGALRACSFHSPSISITLAEIRAAEARAAGLPPPHFSQGFPARHVRRLTHANRWPLTIGTTGLRRSTSYLQHQDFTDAHERPPNRGASAINTK
jgi:hypothetical protein